MNYYLDSTTGTAAQGSCTGSCGPDGYMRIGGGNVSGSSHPFNGVIDEVRIYNRVLSAAEIQAIYSATK